MDFLFIPGVNNTSSTWEATRQFLTTAGYDSVAVDCPAIEDIDELARSIMPNNDKKYIVVGHSFGGMVALSVLSQFPDRVGGVVIVNSTDGNDTPEAASNRLKRAADALNGGYLDIAAGASARAYHPSNVGREDLMAAREVEVAQYGAERFAAHQKAMSTRPNREQVFAQYAQPKLVIAADCDVVIATDKQKLMAERVQARYMEIPKTGHMLPAEAPLELAETIINWTKENF